MTLMQRNLLLEKGDKVVVETERGIGIGWVLYGPEEKDRKKIKFKLKECHKKSLKKRYPKRRAKYWLAE